MIAPYDDLKALIGLNTIAAKKLGAMMNQVENDQAFNVQMLGADLEQLIRLIDAIDGAALKLWKTERYEAEFDTPERYLVSGLPAFTGLPYELINTMTIRAKVSAQVTAKAIQVDSEPMPWDVVPHTLWAISGQIEMIDAVIKRVDTTEASR